MKKYGIVPEKGTVIKMKTRHWLLRAVFVAATVVFAVFFASHGASAEDELDGIGDFYDAIPDEVA